ncbi:unnamed protein product [Diamesa hyperborea]
MKLIILITFLFNISQAYYQIRPSGTIASVTNKGKECMTNCIPYSDYHFCYTGWGSSNWDYCKVKTSDRQVQYFTSMAKGRKPLCTSKCGYFGESYQWCFTGEGGLWDKCSTNRQKCYDCSIYHGGYQCKTSNGDTDSCAPDPIHYYEFDRAKVAFKDNVGTYTDQGFKKCKNRIIRQFSDDETRKIGIFNIANTLASVYNVTYLTSGQPIQFIVTLTVPPTSSSVMLNTRLPLVIRATLRKKYFNNVREEIPYYIEHQMRYMDKNSSSDETGQLLASSLGGPMQGYNFAPQNRIVNKNSDGESYWYHIEEKIRETLRDDNVMYIDWTLIVVYDDLQVHKRPIGFGLKYIVYDIENNPIHDTGDMYFSNEGGCPN